jgi:hypothetical protein
MEQGDMTPGAGGLRKSNAARALAEAETRRAERQRAGFARPREINGRQGPEPVRYGDWENKGIACDF